MERVYTMTDYYDGPREGIADFEGRPHLYERVFDDEEGPTEFFELREVDADTFALALEAWGIWLRWHEAYHSGTTTIETHPALPEDRARHDQLRALLEPRLRAGSSFRVTGQFNGPATRVRWTKA